MQNRSGQINMSKIKRVQVWYEYEYSKEYHQRKRFTQKSNACSGIYHTNTSTRLGGKRSVAFRLSQRAKQHSTAHLERATPLRIITTSLYNNRWTSRTQVKQQTNNPCVRCCRMVVLVMVARGTTLFKGIHLTTSVPRGESRRKRELRPRTHLAQ